jgi:integrase
MAKALMTQRRGGPAHVRMLGLCLKTGQRISDVLKCRAQDCTDEGIEFDQGKTGAPLLVEWDDELRALVDQCFEGRDRIGYLLVQSTGNPYRYSGVKSACQRAMAKSGVEDLHIHDLRGEAGARLADLLGPYAAQLLLGHGSIRMTEHYIAGKTRRRAKPAPMAKAQKAV